MDRLRAKNTALPPQFHTAYKFCFTAHDVIAQLLVSGMQHGIFVTNISFKDEADKVDFEQSENLFDWLSLNERLEEEYDVLVTMVFPAVLSDMLHCIFEALEASRKGKLAIAYMLLRKPLQESLYVLESVISDKPAFANMIAKDPLKLRPQNAGGLEGHTRRIQKVLDVIGESWRFDAGYLAKLRYDKSDRDSFDGICNKAMHLFTEHKAIKTEQYNVNFIFSQSDQIYTQWNYLYSRLPYLLTYIISIVEHVAERFASTLPEYANDMNRRLSAALLICTSSIDERYEAEPLSILAVQTYHWLTEHCIQHGFSEPLAEHLERMANCGAFPNEDQQKVEARDLLYSQLSGNVR